MQVMGRAHEVNAQLQEAYEQRMQGMQGQGVQEGDGSTYFQMFGAQVEQGAVATAYTPTQATAVVADSTLTKSELALGVSIKVDNLTSVAEGDRVELLVDGQRVGDGLFSAVLTAGTTTTVVTLPAGTQLTNGQHDMTVRLVSQTGNAGSASATPLSLTVDSPAVASAQASSLSMAGGNLLRYSQALGDSVWAKDGGLSVVDDASTAPDGSLTAEKLTHTQGSLGRIYQWTTPPAQGELVTFSVYLKGSDVLADVGLYNANPSLGEQFARIDLRNGSLISQSSGLNGVQVQSEGDGWYRVSVTYTSPGTGDGDTALIVRQDSRNGVAGDMEMWGAQAELGSVATHYTETTNATASVPDTNITKVELVAPSALDVLNPTEPTTVALALATDSGSSNSDGITNVGTVNVTGLEAGATWEYSTDNGSTWTAGGWPALGTGTGTSFTLSEGTYAAGAIQVRQTDVAGKVQTTSMATNAAQIVVDTTAPVFMGGTTAIANVNTDTSVAVYIANASDTGGSAVDAGVTYTLGGAKADLFNIAANGQVYYKERPTAAGTQTFAVTATDVAGNATTRKVTLTETADPIITIGVALVRVSEFGDDGFWVLKTVSANLSAPLKSGQALLGSLDGGTTWTDISSSVDDTAIRWGVVVPSWEMVNPMMLEVRDSAGNAAGPRWIHNPFFISMPQNDQVAPPLTLDFNHDGQIDYITDKAQDMDGDGVSDSTAWVANHEAVLFADRNSNGVADSGEWAFGDLARGLTDLQGLALHDGNADGLIDHNDAIWSQLRVWKDTNGDGVSTADEVLTLEQAHIVALSLQSDNQAQQPTAGVQVHGSTLAIMDDGSRMLIHDTTFAYTQQQPVL